MDNPSPMRAATASESGPLHPVVALVASAGGFDALTQVLSSLSKDLFACVLVAQHLPVEHRSRLAHLLNQRTELPVRTAVDNDELTPGTVLVAPAGHHLIVTSANRIGLTEAGPRPPRPSADLLLATLAVTCGPRAVAVVLSGAGSDGQAGVRAIAHQGGTVLAQDQASSAYFAMPHAAIGTGLVHAVLPPRHIAAAIRDHVLSPSAPSPPAPSPNAAEPAHRTSQQVQTLA